MNLLVHRVLDVRSSTSRLGHFYYMNYQRIYDQICQRAKSELEQRKEHKKNEGYYEGHHIVPKCLGGQGHSSNWNHENIVPLTAREHFICHWLLVELYPENKKLAYAFQYMCDSDQTKNKIRYKPSSKIVEYARKLSRDKKTGSKLSDETKLKMSLSQVGNKKWLGKTHSLETIEKMRLSQKGRPSKLKNKKLSDEIKTKMSLCKTGDKNPNYGKSTWNKGRPHPQKIIKCPHCSKEGGISNMKRYHLDNCKNK